MRKKFAGICCFIAVSASPVIAQAANTDHVPIIYGYGIQTCRSYVTAVLKDDLLEMHGFSGWLAGYISLANEMGPKNLSVHEAEEWIEDFCLKNPTKKFWLAAFMYRHKDLMPMPPR